MSFYHAKSKPANINDCYTTKQLVDFTKELTKTIGDEITADWMMRESGKANMRRTVRRVLKKHKYPEEQLEKTMGLIIEQAELL